MIFLLHLQLLGDIQLAGLPDLSRPGLEGPRWLHSFTCLVLVGLVEAWGSLALLTSAPSFCISSMEGSGLLERVSYESDEEAVTL